MSGTDGVVVVLNGVPRSGKSSIAAEIVSSFDGEWVNLGVDSVIAATPPDLWPGIGLRPGGERPDLEPLVLSSYQELFDELAATSRRGVNVVVDVGLHDDYSEPLGVVHELARRLAGQPMVMVGVRCSFEVQRQRRTDAGYLAWEAGEPVPDPVLRWDRAVHADKTYDLEVDTSAMSSHGCAAVIRRFITAEG